MPLQQNNNRHNSEESDQRPGVFVALGSNTAFEDDTGRLLEGAGLFSSVVQALNHAGMLAIRISSHWLSPAWPDPTLGNFSNAVVEVDCSTLDAQEVLCRLLEIEVNYGRKRTVKNAPRTLDLDLIDFKGEVISTSTPYNLQCPHPRMHERSFVMGPLMEICPNWRHPVSGEEGSDLMIAALKNWPAQSSDSITLLDTQK